jgi:hypothetical protein
VTIPTTPTEVDDEAPPRVTINVAPAYVKVEPGAPIFTPRQRSVLTEEPIVRRHNAWGQWAPLIADSLPHPSLNTYEPEVAGALRYREVCGCEGFEFVVVTTHRDDAKFRTLASGILIIPVEDPDWPRDGVPSSPVSSPPYYLYDGWMPVEEDGPEAARVAVSTLGDTLDFFAYQYGIRLRWMVKYAENFGTVKRLALRNTGESEDAFLRDRLSRLVDLPLPVRSAVQRAAHWHHNHTHQERHSDRFLALWLALESLVLVLYENCGALGLVVVNEEAGLSKRQRKRLRDQRVEATMAAHGDLSPSERVAKAYFEGIVGIRRRVEAVLAAVFQSNEQMAWLYTSTAPPSPADLRSKIVHEGWSEYEVIKSCDLSDYCQRLSLLLKELIERVLHRSWGGVYDLPRRQYWTSMILENGAVGANIRYVGDFRMSLGLLLRKGVIGIV